MFHDEKHVITGDGIIMWDGITKPEVKEGGAVVHSLKIALVNNDPTISELNQIATKCLQDSKFKGQLPPGGIWPFQQVDATKFDGMLPAHTSLNAKTYRGAPQVYDANGRELNPMEYASLLYPGAIVQALVHTYSYDDKSKGVAFGLDGIRIIRTDAPKLPVGGIDASTAFGTPGAAPAAYTPPAAPGMAPPPAGMPPAAVPPAYVPPAAPGMPPAYAPPPTAAPPPAFVPPAAPDFLQPGGQAPKQMTAKAAGASYEQFINAGWTDAQLIEQGYLLSHDGVPF